MKSTQPDRIRTSKSRWTIALFPSGEGPKSRGWYRWKWQAESALLKIHCTTGEPVLDYSIESARYFDVMCAAWDRLVEQMRGHR